MSYCVLPTVLSCFHLVPTHTAQMLIVILVNSSNYCIIELVDTFDGKSSADVVFKMIEKISCETDDEKNIKAVLITLNLIINLEKDSLMLCRYIFSINSLNVNNIMNGQYYLYRMIIICIRFQHIGCL